VGRGDAHDLVSAAARRATEGGRAFRDELLEDPAIREHLSDEEIDRALDPAAYLGAAGQFVDRALGRHRERR
jgi:3-carboxy-cis,cis-muconate cycloisomerase